MRIEINRKPNGEVQNLTEVLPEIPTNTILYKKLTGIGATFGELKAKRNSIIIEPNKPVISGKCSDPKHTEDNLLGVFEGVYADKIADYLRKTVKAKKHIKIITTPESFNKVRNAFEDADMDIQDCFLLFDECHKIAKDVDYRKNIQLPIDLFFQCANKALVSATPLNFTDPRFKDFSMIEIEPTFDFKKDIKLHITNNILQRTKELLAELPEDRSIFMFCNSTDNILALMEQLDIKEQSAVFCSQNSVQKLKENKFKNASDIWNIEKMRRYNFMTSRFYNAFDLILDEKPIVALFTDCQFTEYTCFDPYADTWQCVGRFRNGVSEIHHITNTSSKYRYKTIDEVKETVNIHREIYSQFYAFRKGTAKLSAKEAYAVAMERLPYTEWLNADNSENHFLIDNYMDDELVKGYYSSPNTLEEQYSESGYFNVKADIENYKLGDYDRLRRYNKSQSIKEKRKILVGQLEMLEKCETELDFEFKAEIEKADRFIVEAYDKIGKAEIERLKYNKKKISEAMIVADYNEKAQGTEVLRAVRNSFKEKQWYTCNYISTELERIFKLFGMKITSRVPSKRIEDFFEAVKQTKSNQRGYYLSKCRTI